MFKSNSKLLLSLIAGAAVAGVAGTFWLGGIENNTHTVASYSKAMAMTSVWDKEITKPCKSRSNSIIISVIDS
ncbi:MAG: hypothetical protein AAFY76_19730 [Cyanobacteria bacterium J06649_11]